MSGKIRISESVISQLSGLNYAAKEALAGDLQGANNVAAGINYTTLLRYIQSNHFILTLPYNQQVIRKHLGLAPITPILETFKNGRYVADKAVETSAA